MMATQKEKIDIRKYHIIGIYISVQIFILSVGSDLVRGIGDFSDCSISGLIMNYCFYVILLIVIDIFRYMAFKGVDNKIKKEKTKS